MVTKETPETFYIGNTVATKVLMSLKRLKWLIYLY